MSFKVRGSLARKALIELAEKGLIKEKTMKMSEGDSLVQGLKSRLAAKHKLQEKLVLTAGVMNANISIPNKEQIIVEWFGTLLGTKYSLNSSEDLEINLVWDGFLVCLRLAELNLNFTLETSFLQDIVDFLDLSNPTVEAAMNIILRLINRSELNIGETLGLISKIWNKDTKHLLTEEILKIFNKLLNHFKPTPDLGLGELLAKMSMDLELLKNQLFLKIFRVSVFHKLSGYENYFKILTQADSEKYIPTHEVQMFIEFILSGGEISLAFAALSGPECPSWLQSHLFSLALYLEGYKQVYHADSPFLIPLLSNYKPSSDRLVRIFNHALPLDLKYSINEELTVNNLISGCVKFSIEKYKIKSNMSQLIFSVFTHHPLILDPLTSLILTRYMLDSSAPILAFQTVLDLALKLRQLPKLISRLFLYLRTSSDLTLSWRQTDLKLFGEAISQVPRVQSVEIWKSLLYHLSADCIKVLDTDKGIQVWRIAIPLLSTVLQNAHLSDHNLPAPLAVRVKDLISSTLNDVLKAECLDPARKADVLYSDLASSLIELVELITTYRGFEFEDIFSFRDQMIKTALKKKEMLGYSNVIVQGLRGNSSYTDKIWKQFHEDLLSDSRTLNQVFRVIPREYLAALNLEENIEELLESPVYSAIVIFSELDKFKKDNLLGPVLNLELWTSPDNWNSLQSELGLGLQRILEQVYNLQGGVLTPGLDKLLQLPVEYLPKTQKLGLNVLCIIQLLSGEDIKNIDELLCRSFEETDVFRFISSSTFLEKILPLEFSSHTFLEVVSSVVAKYSKMMTELSDDFGNFQDGILKGDLNYLHFFVSLLENLSHPILHVGVVKEKKSAAEKLSLQITKVLCKHVRKEEALAPSNLLIRACAAIVKSSKLCTEESEGWNKTLKLIRRVLESTLVDGSADSLILVLELMEGGDKWEVLLSEETIQLARNIALGNWACVEGSKFISKLLDNATRIEQTLEYALFQPGGIQLEIVNIILGTKFSEDTKPVVKEQLENLIFRVLVDESIAVDRKCEFVEKLLSATPPLVSANVETAALASIFSNPSPETLKCCVTFMHNRPNMSAKHIPLICTAVRAHLHYIEINCDTESNFKICSELLNILGLTKRKKDDWGSVAPYLVADILQTNLLLEDQKLKQSLASGIQTLLDICDNHTHEYLSANLSPAANEVFKISLETHKNQHKFTANTT